MSIEAISKDDYYAWKNDEVTKRFMAEMLINLQNTEKERIYGVTDTDIIRAAHARNEALNIYENILVWKPIELENQEEVE